MRMNNISRGRKNILPRYTYISKSFLNIPTTRARTFLAAYSTIASLDTARRAFRSTLLAFEYRVRVSMGRLLKHLGPATYRLPGESLALFLTVPAHNYLLVYHIDNKIQLKRKETKC